MANRWVCLHGCTLRRLLTFRRQIALYSLMTCDTEHMSTTHNSSLVLIKQLPPEDSIELLDETGAGYRCHLQQQCSCNAEGHTCCFATLDRAQVLSTMVAIDAWVSTSVSAPSLPVLYLVKELYLSFLDQQHSNEPSKSHYFINRAFFPVMFCFRYVYGVWEYNSIPASILIRPSQPHRLASCASQSP